MEIKEDLFDNVKPGSRVHYLTPQGQTRSGTVVMNRGTHLVLNRGGGQPQVVTPKNYIKHSEGGKVKGALLSNLAKSMKKEETVNEIHKLAKAYLKKTAPGSEDAEKIDSGLDNAMDNPKDKRNSAVARKAFNRLQGRENAKERVGLRGILRRASMKTEAKLPRTGTDEIADMEPKVNAVYDMDPQLKAKLTKKLLRKRKQIVKEDAALDAQKSALAYTTKMQKKKKKRTLKTMKEEILNELGGETLSRYVTKALADRKKQAGMADMAHRIHTPERAKYFANKAAARIAKRTQGVKTALGKIASNLPAEPLAAHTAGEKSKHGGWSGMGEGFKAGDKVRLKSDWAHGDPDKVYKIWHTNGDGQHWIGDKNKRGWYAGDHQLRPARTWKKTYTMEARESEYRANQQLAGTTVRRQPGHYLTRDGRTLSGPHKPDEAVRAYKDMSDNRNVKIVHVKEATNPENKMDNNDKASKVAQRAIALAKSKKKKGNVNVEPELETPSSQMSQPLLQGAEGPVNVRV